MNEKKLNDELTIVGLILTLGFLLYYLSAYINYSIHLESKVNEAQSIAILLDKRLTKTEQSLANTNQSLDSVNQILKDVEFYKRIQKDLDRTWSEQKWWDRHPWIMLFRIHFKLSCYPPRSLHQHMWSRPIVESLPSWTQHPIQFNPSRLGNLPILLREKQPRQTQSNSWVQRC